MQIRDAVEQDFHAITKIYNDILLNTTAIYREEPILVEEALSMWRARLQLGCPTLVAVCEQRIAGYAAFSSFRAWPGYRFTVEHTVHVDKVERGKGVGSALVGELVVRATALRKHVMIGAIDSENAASLRFHERLGFRRVAHFEEVGFKFNRYLDLIFVQRILSEAASA
jgi:L-amino acid N-acyltransferase YncA